MRRRLRQLLLIGLAAISCWVAAPALSSRPYVPPAVDFEQRLPTVNAKRSHAGLQRTPVLSAPDRFDLVGLTGERRELEIRARDEGGEWSAWVETADGGPIWFGGADELQLRARGWRPEGVLHYVNASGTTSPGDGLLTAVRSAVNSAFISVAETLQPAAEALPARPAMVSRAAWGAESREGGCPPRAGASYGRVKAGVVHHTVTANDYSRAEAPRIVLAICRYHRNGNGWNDIGYNALVDRFGTLYVGREGDIRRAVVGAHAQGFNAQTSGIASIGTHGSLPISPAARGAVVDFLAWKLALHGVGATGKTTMTSAGGDASRYPAGRRVRTNKVIGHGTVGFTSCPGSTLAAAVPKIRRQVQEEIAQSGGEPPPVPEPPDGGGLIPK